jgi:lipopolysaccharide export LptBFGC system permease protein LptF
MLVDLERPMKLLSWLGLSMLGWTGLVLTLVVGVVVLATGVEQASGGWAGFGGALLVAPEVAVALMPLCCAMGAALTLTRRMGAGEDVGLGACGIRPLRSGRGVVAVGLAFGLLSLLMADHVVPRMHRARPTPTWVWVDGALFRPSDGRRVNITDGRIRGIDEGIRVAPEALRRAGWNRLPRLAPDIALRDSTAAPMVVEFWSRRARVILCGLLAWIGWVPVGRRGASQVAWALSAGAVTTGVDLLLRQLTVQGRMPPFAGAIGALMMLICLAVALRGRS